VPRSDASEARAFFNGFLGGEGFDLAAGEFFRAALRLNNPRFLNHCPIDIFELSGGNFRARISRQLFAFMFPSLPAISKGAANVGRRA